MCTEWQHIRKQVLGWLSDTRRLLEEGSREFTGEEMLVHLACCYTLRSMEEYLETAFEAASKQRPYAAMACLRQVGETAFVLSWVLMEEADNARRVRRWCKHTRTHEKRFWERLAKSPSFATQNGGGPSQRASDCITWLAELANVRCLPSPKELNADLSASNALPPPLPGAFPEDDLLLMVYEFLHAGAHPQLSFERYLEMNAGTVASRSTPADVPILKAVALTSPYLALAAVRQHYGWDLTGMRYAYEAQMDRLKR